MTTFTRFKEGHTCTCRYSTTPPPLALPPPHSVATWLARACGLWWWVRRSCQRSSTPASRLATSRQGSAWQTGTNRYTCTCIYMYLTSLREYMPHTSSVPHCPPPPLSQSPSQSPFCSSLPPPIPPLPDPLPNPPVFHQVSAVVSSLEDSLELLCITGVEDQLQTDVRPTLELLKNAGIRVKKAYVHSVCYHQYTCMCIKSAGIQCIRHIRIEIELCNSKLVHKKIHVLTASSYMYMYMYK